MVNTTIISQQYVFTPGSAPASFPFLFAYQKTTEIYAVLSEAGLTNVPLTQGVDFLVTGPTPSGGTLTRLGTWNPSYGKLTIYRSTATLNETSFTNGGEIDADILERSIDELTQMAQELAPGLSRALSVPITDFPPSLLPDAATRANAYLYFDSSGNPTASPGGPSGVVAISSIMVPVVGSATVRLAMNKLIADPYDSSNLAIGAGALAANLTSVECTAVGINALASIQNGMTGSTAFGYNALSSNLTGQECTAFGDRALESLRSGNSHTAIGFLALQKCDGVNINTAVGASALRWDTVGDGNTGLGYSAGRELIDGFQNTAVGAFSMTFAQSCNNCTGCGYETLYNITTGDNNTAVGNVALRTLQTGQANCAFGQASLYSYTGTGATAYGYESGMVAVDGLIVAVGYASLAACTSGTFNVAVGYEALRLVTTTSSNTAVGHAALRATTGSSNTAVGSTALKNATGSFLTAVGESALRNNTTGAGSTAVGWDALYTQTIANGCVALGYQAGYWETASNKLFIDNQARASEADGRAKALIYGVFDASIANQSIQINGKFGCNGATPQGVYGTVYAPGAYAGGVFGLDSDGHMQALYLLVKDIRAALIANGIMLAI